MVQLWCRVEVVVVSQVGRTGDQIIILGGEQAGASRPAVGLLNYFQRGGKPLDKRAAGADE